MTATLLSVIRQEAIPPNRLMEASPGAHILQNRLKIRGGFTPPGPNGSMNDDICGEQRARCGARRGSMGTQPRLQPD
jgi:hypothetical protein